MEKGPWQTSFTAAKRASAGQPYQGDRMNKDTVEGNWKQLKGKVKEQWGKLTDDDFDVIAGKRDQLLGRIQERHGISREEAEKQVKTWESADGRTPDALWFERY
jgi:uncharacterized protein YjbJ (UPF0337 family)